jgi:exodeoxyribonuclease V alpha subunit
VTAEGRWVQDREFGRQFRAEMLKSTAPTTKEGIEKYLGSGMVKGIGPVYAKKLVDKFGEQIFEIIETASARLEELEGIGPKRRKRIKDAWAEQKGHPADHGVPALQRGEHQPGRAHLQDLR